MKRCFKIVGIFLIFSALLINISAFGQETQKQLEKKRSKIESEIAYTNKLIKETKSNKKNTINQLQLINLKINGRVDLLANVKSEIYIINNKIQETETSLTKLDENLTSLKSKYIEIAWHAFKYKTAYNKLIFLFSADDFNQAYQRMRYLDEISSYIRKEAEIIKKTESEKEKKLAQLKTEKEKKEILLKKEVSELSHLEKEQNEKNNIKNNLKKKERQLRASLKKKEKQKRKLANQIKQIISAETAPKKDKNTGKKYGLTPSEKKLSSSFFASKGKLPWPTQKGIISETFGVHKHPVLKKVKTKNNGINILTEKNSNARAIYNGKVVSITHISNTNIAVIVKHGNFFTVYSNLEKVFVNKGENVSTKQEIGKIHTNLEGKTELHFEIWNGSSIQNPIYWIAKK